MFDDNDVSESRRRYAGFGMSLGLILGGAVGVALWQANDDFIWFIIFSGAGLVLGMALGAAVGEGQ